MAQDYDAKRALSILTIAQLKFKQALKKEEPEARLPPVSVEASSQFFSDLGAVLNQNTRVNVQKCTEWIVRHTSPSQARIAVFGDYLVSLSKSIGVDQQPAAAAQKAARNRLDLLLIISDILHSDKYHRRGTSKQTIFSKESASFVAELVDLAAVCITEKDTPAEKKLRAIINYWNVNQLVSVSDYAALRDRADESLLVAQGGTPVRKRNYLLPEYHGDKTAPWHDLPASYMLEQMIKHPTRAIDPSRIRVARLDKKPVSALVHKLLDNYFENIDIKYVPTGDNPTGETARYKLGLDPMGQVVKKDKETGEATTVCSGYGWSLKFCQDMQKHGVPENIRTAREDIERMGDTYDVAKVPQGSHISGRSAASSRRRRRSTSRSNYKRERSGPGCSSSDSRSRRGSISSLDSQRSRPNTRDRSHSRRRESPVDNRKESDDRGRRFDERDQNQPRPPPKPYGRGSSQSESPWNGSNGPNWNIQGYSNNQYSAAQQSHPGPSSLGRGFVQAHQAPFPQPPLPSQFPVPFPMGPFSGQHPPPPPPQFQVPGGFVPPPPPPPNYNGQFPPSPLPPPPPPNMAGMPPLPQNFGNEYGTQVGNNFVYGQNQGGFPAGPGGYGGNARGGPYHNKTNNHNNHGSQNGGQRGQRGARY